jgi:hypothetical protein
MTNAMDAVKNRVTIKEQDLLVAGAQFFSQIHLLHEGEALSARGNNLMTRGTSFTWTGTTWTVGNVGAAALNSVLDRWPGATTGSAGNGADDGRFRVAVKVTGPVNGRWHYEYAVHNIDNQRGGATLRIPLCNAASAFDIGFRDIDGDALNEWLANDTGSELVFTAPASNPQNWNTLFNFWFDCDAAPVAGDVTIDQARIGPGALSLQVPSQVPGFVPVTQLGAGCGTPPITLAPNGLPSIPNPAFALVASTTPVTGVFAFYSFGAANVPLGGGCVQYLDGSAIGTLGFVLTGTGGTANLPLAIPAGIMPIDLFVQAISLVNPGTGALFGEFNLSNGLGLRIGGTGCP